jgi:hypothetical protein
MMGYDGFRARAVKRVWMKRAFRLHAVSFTIGSFLMLLIWSSTGGGYFWPVWPITGWGAGLAAQGWATFGSWRISEAAIQREMQKETERSLRDLGMRESAHSGESR